MLKSALGPALILVVWPLTASAQPLTSTPLGYFSPQRAFAASPEGRDAETRLTALQAERAKELDARNERLKALQDALQRSGSVLSPTARQEREREIDRFQVDILLFVINEDEGLIAWADPAADITPDVVRRLTPQAAR